MEFIIWLQSWTKAVETLPEKDLFCETREFFQSPIFTFRPPLPFSMLYPRDSVIEAYFNIKKGVRGLSYRQKRCFFETTDGSR